MDIQIRVFQMEDLSDLIQKWERGDKQPPLMNAYIVPRAGNGMNTLLVT